MTGTVTIWVTKYALTEGILQYEVAAEDVGDKMVAIRPRKFEYCTQYYHGEGRDWHRTKDAALARAWAMQAAKIASHEKSIARLQKFVPVVKAGDAP